jgi:RNA polymerase sigma-70 factor (ECF subfamily)
MNREKKLIIQLKNGDKDALRYLYVEHKDFLLTLANALLHDIALAEDVVHDVFVTFVRNIQTFQLRGSLKAYFATCAANGARSILRKQKVHAKSTNFAVEPVSNADHAQSVENQELSRRVNGHLKELPFDQRQVLILRIKAGMRFKEIARIQKVSVPTVQGRYRYGMDKLRSLLNGEL